MLHKKNNLLTNCYYLYYYLHVHVSISFLRHIAGRPTSERSMWSGVNIGLSFSQEPKWKFKESQDGGTRMRKQSSGLYMN